MGEQTCRCCGGAAAGRGGGSPTAKPRQFQRQTFSFCRLALTRQRGCQPNDNPTVSHLLMVPQLSMVSRGAGASSNCSGGPACRPSRAIRTWATRRMGRPEASGPVRPKRQNDRCRLPSDGAPQARRSRNRQGAPLESIEVTGPVSAHDPPALTVSVLTAIDSYPRSRLEGNCLAGRRAGGSRTRPRLYCAQ